MWKCEFHTVHSLTGSILWPSGLKLQTLLWRACPSPYLVFLSVCFSSLSFIAVLWTTWLWLSPPLRHKIYESKGFISFFSFSALTLEAVLDTDRVSVMFGEWWNNYKTIPLPRDPYITLSYITLSWQWWAWWYGSQKWQYNKEVHSENMEKADGQMKLFHLFLLHF